MSGPEHYIEAERLIVTADEWMNADTGWRAHLSTAERIAGSQNDLAAAQVHATLALAAAVGVGMPLYLGGEQAMPDKDSHAWRKAAGAS